MARGTPLTPEQLEDLGRLYAETGNAAAVARTLGVSVSTVTRQLARLGEQQRAILQGDALAVGMLVGQAYLDGAIEVVGDTLLRGAASTDGVEPDDAQKLVTALSRATATLAALQRREEQRLQAALTREKTRAEITAIQVRVDELPPMEVLKAKLSPAQVVELVRGLTLEQLAAAEALTQPKEALSEKDG